MALHGAVEWACVLVHEHHRKQRVYWIAPGLLFEAIYSFKAIDFWCPSFFFAVFSAGFFRTFENTRWQTQREAASVMLAVPG